MRLLAFSLGALCMTVATGLAAAHPHAYVGESDLHLIWAGCPDANELGPGYVCFEAGEPGGGPFGSVVFTITDSVGSATGFYCQDLDDDSFCGEESIPVIGQTPEPGESFCTAVSVTPGFDYHPAFPAYVFINGPLGGLPGISACEPAASFGTLGSVDHS